MKIILIITAFLFIPTFALATPIITEISAHYTQDAFLFEASYEAHSAAFDPFTEGGWAFQLFLDTDQNDLTGYSGRGFDFNLRGIEQETPGQIHARRTSGGSGPGGWGESTGTVALVVEETFFSIMTPLSLLDDDDGRLDYRLELYETVVASSPSGVSHEYRANYDGSSTSAPVPEPATMLLFGAGLAVLSRLGMRHKKNMKNNNHQTS